MDIETLIEVATHKLIGKSLFPPIFPPINSDLAPWRKCLILRNIQTAFSLPSLFTFNRKNMVMAKLNLLHVSDIHFHAPLCTTDLDPDRPIRTALINSVRDSIKNIGTIDAILVSGDIAYQGDSTEYEHATKWLSELASAANCKNTNILVVPGNHDCDRRTIRQRPEIIDTQNAIRGTDQRIRDRALWDRLLKESSRNLLIAPLAAYNEFAAKYECDIYPVERLFWRKIFPLPHGFTLHLRGITSTLLSGPDDVRGSLFISTLQTAFDPLPGVIHGAMQHHPPSWLLEGDEDAVDDALREGTKIHFMGHKHKQRLQQVDSHVRYSAGAVNPEREELEWKPGYNICCLDIVKDENKFLLHVESHVMDWQSSPDLFRPRQTPEGKLVFEHFIDVSRIAPDIKPSAQTETIATAPELPAPIKDVGLQLPEVQVNALDIKDIVFRFWALKASEKRQITKDLGLDSDEDLDLPEHERYRRAFAKAKSLDLVAALAARIDDLQEK